MARRDKALETESRLLVAGAEGGRREGGGAIRGTGFSGGDGNVLE